MNERSIFFETLDRDTLAERSAYLDSVCGEDAALRQRVEALLHAHEEAGNFLDKTAPERLAAEQAARGEPEQAPMEPLLDDGAEPLSFLSPSSKPGVLGQLDHYEVLEVVGRGGMGVVLRALDTKLQRVVALKVLAASLAASGSARKRFAREARAAAAVRDEHVIDIHAVRDDAPVPYLVMEYIDGCNLEALLRKSGPLEVKEILRIGMQVASGLAAAHKQGLIHRDVKPANILLENGVQRVKLTDFGLARAADDASLTQTGFIAGTPLYMAPEQAAGEPIDTRADLFSLGSVLYELCTGRPAFRAETTVAVIRRVCDETPRSIREVNPDIPECVCQVIERLHAKKPADRPATATEVADLLARLLADLQHPGPLSHASWRRVGNVPKSPPASGKRAPRRWLWVAALVLLVAGLGLSEATGLSNVRGTVIRLFSVEGTLVVELDDPGVSVSLNGEELVITGAGVREIRLKPGQYQVKATKDGKILRQELVAVAKDGRQVVRISRESDLAQVEAADAAAWERRVAALPAEEQVKAVAARLKELNPDFDGQVTPTIVGGVVHTIDGGVVTELKFSADYVTNLAPVRALSHLTVLDCSGTYPKKGRLADLSPLKGMSLKTLICQYTSVSDLSPLKGMPLTYFHCTNTQVSDLSPLQGMPLRRLQAEMLPISDLSPLRGMRLTYLGLYRTDRVSDLSPLKGMPLVYLNLGHLPVSDLSLLKDMTTLQYLVLGDTPVSDLSALKGLSLKTLRIRNTKVFDLSPLKGMPLQEIWLDYKPERDAEVLRSLKILEQINGIPAREVLERAKEVEVKPLTGFPNRV